MTSPQKTKNAAEHVAGAITTRGHGSNVSFHSDVLLQRQLWARINAASFVSRCIDRSDLLKGLPSWYLSTRTSSFLRLQGTNNFVGKCKVGGVVLCSVCPTQIVICVWAVKFFEQNCNSSNGVLHRNEKSNIMRIRDQCFILQPVMTHTVLELSIRRRHK